MEGGSTINFLAGPVRRDKTAQLAYVRYSHGRLFNSEKGLCSVQTILVAIAQTLARMTT
jgi:hypothetical protein